MKVAMNETAEVSDDDLIRIANLLDGRISRRRAKREEARAWIWSVGAEWPLILADRWDEEFVGNAADPTPDDNADLF